MINKLFVTKCIQNLYPKCCAYVIILYSVYTFVVYYRLGADYATNDSQVTPSQKCHPKSSLYTHSTHYSLTSIST